MKEKLSFFLKQGVALKCWAAEVVLEYAQSYPKVQLYAVISSEKQQTGLFL